MIKCLACSQQEYEGELFCSNCGARLWASPGETIPTIGFTNTAALTRASGEAAKPLMAAVSTQDLGAGQVAVQVGQAVIVLTGKNEYLIGREGGENEIPDVNLGPHGGRDKGVSRRHALLRVDRRQLLLMDLGSSNGTWLNGTQLSANEPMRLESGDDIRLGKITVKIKFNL
jgi:pSer/pThr/pTyr-binding forkhead associated (FHA) protein